MNIVLTKNDILAKHEKTYTGQHLYKPDKIKTFTSNKSSNQPEPGHDNEEPFKGSHCDASLTPTKILNQDIEQKTHTTHSEILLTDSDCTPTTSQLLSVNNQTSTNGIHADKSQNQEEHQEMPMILDKSPVLLPVMPDPESMEYGGSVFAEDVSERILPDTQDADDTYLITQLHSAADWSPPSTSGIHADKSQDQEEIVNLQAMHPPRPPWELSPHHYEDDDAPLLGQDLDSDNEHGTPDFAHFDSLSHSEALISLHTTEK